MKVADINWDTWIPEETATLMFVIKEDQILLIRKKRGLGAGKINGPGGRLKQGESLKECAIRETREELLINPLNVEFRGELFFHAEDMPRIHGYVFTASDYEGTPTETEEAIPMWFSVTDIPYIEMWEDDKFWLPQVIAGQVVDAWFIFAGESVLDHKVTIREV
ncbi:MAG: 8-oxo-dGTP diphosphatase [Gammaproteobacteria bacterium]|nr:8-oxo-dGTP diphosphatase [Gammaproteobacteria bacterium]